MSATAYRTKPNIVNSLETVSSNITNLSLSTCSKYYKSLSLHVLAWRNARLRAKIVKR